MIVKLTTSDPIMEQKNAIQGDFMTGPVTALQTVGDNIVLAGTCQASWYSLLRRGCRLCLSTSQKRIAS